MLGVLQNSNPNWGYNAATEKFEDLVENGVIDPTLVVRSSLQNAASVAGLVLTTEVMIVNKPKKEKQNPQMME
jgi:chaperonin GroEL